MLANNYVKKYRIYYLGSIARDALPIVCVMPAVREGYSDMKQTKTETLESPNQTLEGDETGLLN